MSGAPDVVLIDGEARTQVSVLDRGLHYGDGLFETIACKRGRARFLSLHLQRLLAGCERLGIRFDASSQLRDEIRQLASGRDASLIKVIVTRGSATGRGYGARGDETATRVVMRYSWPQEDASWWNDGVVVRLAVQRVGENPALAGLKHLNRLEQVLARSEWSDPQTLEALVFSSSGLLVSGTMSNVFIVRNRRLLTPSLDRFGVAGVMRRVVLQEALRAGIAREECALTAVDLDEAEEIFVTNARIGIWPVRAIGARTLTVGPVTRRLQKLIHPLLEVPADESEKDDIATPASTTGAGTPGSPQQHKEAAAETPEPPRG
jgi:4-amino-4-deoxychorismate lyase